MEQVYVQRLSRGVVLIILLILVGAIAAVSALEVHKACFEAFPFAKPEDGTPRADYCSVLSKSRPWLSLTLLPLMLMAAAGLVVLRTTEKRWPLILLAVVVVLGVVGNAVIANQLRFYRFAV